MAYHVMCGSLVLSSHATRHQAREGLWYIKQKKRAEIKRLKMSLKTAEMFLANCTMDCTNKPEPSRVHITWSDVVE